ncbi:sugar ABC transporter ATP-binding protein [Luteococcus sp. H138]|uniref:sugar ABC transporter ATP-binding protein n=1 Tax=unclassified Luteococcus TaxID=2639923 RepID=UPI00313E64AD
MNNAVRLTSISKRFGHNKVLKGVDIDVREGTVHALVGENGAGKSTLLNILHGVYQDYDGELEVLGQKVNFKNPLEAIHHGISKVHQEIQIAPELTVGQNIALGSEVSAAGFIRRAEQYKRIDAILADLGCSFTSRTRAGDLSVGQIQMVAIAKSLFHEARVISFDEPTASLSDRESEILFRVIGELKEKGITIIYVSHRLDEVMTLSDDISVLRDGVVIGTWPRGEISKEQMIEKMVGRQLNAVLAVTREAGQQGGIESLPALKVTGLSGDGFTDVSFELLPGEILGFSGLVGAGRSELVETIFGARKKSAGTVEIFGKAVDIDSPRRAVGHGIALIPEDRKRQGFVPNLDNQMNMFLPLFERNKTWVVNRRAIAKNFSSYGEPVNVQPADPKYLTASLSGGNQQKVILAKWLAIRPEILILDEPTKGIDVGTKSEIYLLIHKLAEDGKAVIVVSSELPEILGISHRIIVMHEGRVTANLVNSGLDEKTVLNHAMGALQ